MSLLVPGCRAAQEPFCLELGQAQQITSPGCYTQHQSRRRLLSTALIKLSTHCLQIISNNRWQQNKDYWELVLSLSSNKITRPTNSLFHSMQELLQQREMHCTNTSLHRKQTYPFRFQVFSRVIFLVCFLHFPAPSA